MPESVKESKAHAQALFWMQMGKDIGELNKGLQDLSGTFVKFCNNEFHSVVQKQEEMEEKLNKSIVTTGIIVGTSMVVWTIANVLLHIFKVL